MELAAFCSGPTPLPVWKLDFTCQCVVELFQWNAAIIKNVFRLYIEVCPLLVGVSVETGSYLPHPGGCVFLCKVAREKWCKDAWGCTKSIIRCGQIANAFICLAVTVFKGCFKASHPKGGCFHLPYLHPTAGCLIAEVLLWGNASSCDCRSLRLEQSCPHPCAPSPIIGSRQSTGFSLVLLLTWSFWDLKAFIILYPS